MIHHPRLGRIIIRIHHERYTGLHVNARLELFCFDLKWQFRFCSCQIFLY